MAGITREQLEEAMKDEQMKQVLGNIDAICPNAILTNRARLALVNLVLTAFDEGYAAGLEMGECGERTDESYF